MQVCVAPLPQLQMLKGKPYKTELQTSEVCLVLSIPHLPPVLTLQICPVWKYEFKNLSTFSADFYTAAKFTHDMFMLKVWCKRGLFCIAIWKCPIPSFSKMGRRPNISVKLLKSYSLQKTLNLLKQNGTFAERAGIFFWNAEFKSFQIILITKLH